MSQFLYQDFCSEEPLAVSSPLGSPVLSSSLESLNTCTKTGDIFERSLLNRSFASLRGLSDSADGPDAGVPCPPSDRQPGEVCGVDDTAAALARQLALLSPQKRLRFGDDIQIVYQDCAGVKQRHSVAVRPAPGADQAGAAADFLNRCITVSAETLSRVSAADGAAGGRPWCSLLPAAGDPAPPADPLVSCRAVVCLRRLRPAELRLWTGPGRRAASHHSDRNDLMEMDASGSSIPTRHEQSSGSVFDPGSCSLGSGSESVMTSRPNSALSELLGSVSDSEVQPDLNNNTNASSLSSSDFCPGFGAAPRAGSGWSGVTAGSCPLEKGAAPAAPTPSPARRGRRRTGRWRHAGRLSRTKSCGSDVQLSGSSADEVASQARPSPAPSMACCQSRPPLTAENQRPKAPATLKSPKLKVSSLVTPSNLSETSNSLSPPDTSRQKAGCLSSPARQQLRSLSTQETDREKSSGSSGGSDSEKLKLPSTPKPLNEKPNMSSAAEACSEKSSALLTSVSSGQKPSLFSTPRPESQQFNLPWSPEYDNGKSNSWCSPGALSGKPNFLSTPGSLSQKSNLVSTPDHLGENLHAPHTHASVGTQLEGKPRSADRQRTSVEPAAENCSPDRGQVAQSPPSAEQQPDSSAEPPPGPRLAAERSPEPAARLEKVAQSDAADPSQLDNRDPVPDSSSGPAPGPSSDPAPGPSCGPAPGPSCGPAPVPSCGPAPGPSFGPAPGPSCGPAPGPSSDSCCVSGSARGRARGRRQGAVARRGQPGRRATDVARSREEVARQGVKRSGSAVAKLTAKSAGMTAVEASLFVLGNRPSSLRKDFVIPKKIRRLSPPKAEPGGPVCNGAPIVPERPAARESGPAGPAPPPERAVRQRVLPPSPSPAAADPGRPRRGETSSEDDSRDLSAEIEALRAKYRSSSEEEESVEMPEADDGRPAQQEADVTPARQAGEPGGNDSRPEEDAGTGSHHGGDERGRQDRDAEKGQDSQTLATSGEELSLDVDSDLDNLVEDDSPRSLGEDGLPAATSSRNAAEQPEPSDVQKSAAANKQGVPSEAAGTRGGAILAPSVPSRPEQSFRTRPLAEERGRSEEKQDGGGTLPGAEDCDLKSRLHPDREEAKCLAEYRHLDVPGYCVPFLQRLPCACDGLDTHKLPPVRHLAAALSRLAAAGRYRDAMGLVRAACRRSGYTLPPDGVEHLYSLVIQACVQAGEPNSALELVGDLRRTGVRSPDLFQSMLQPLRPSPGLSGGLTAVIAAVIAGSVLLHPATWHLLLQTCVQSDAVEATWKTLTKMITLCLVPAPWQLEMALEQTLTRPVLLERTAQFVARHPLILGSARPQLREAYLEKLRQRGLVALADTIWSQLPPHQPWSGDILPPRLPLAHVLRQQPPPPVVIPLERPRAAWLSQQSARLPVINPPRMPLGQEWPRTLRLVNQEPSRMPLLNREPPRAVLYKQELSRTPLYSQETSLTPLYNQKASRMPFCNQEPSCAQLYIREPSRTPPENQDPFWTPPCKQESLLMSFCSQASRTPLLNQQPLPTLLDNHIEPSPTSLHNQEPSRTPVYNQDPTRTPLHNLEPSRTPVYNQEPPWTPLYNREPSRTPLYTQEPSWTPFHNQEPSRTPLHDQEPSRTPLHNQEPSRTPLYNLEPSRTPLYNQEPSRTPAYNQEAQQMPLHNHELSRTPLYNQDQSRTPLHNQEQSRTPLYNQDQPRTPLHNQEQSRTPLNNQEPSRTPLNNQEPSRTPLHNQEQSRTSLDNQEQSRTPLQNQEQSGTPLHDREAPWVLVTCQERLKSPATNHEWPRTPFTSLELVPIANQDQDGAVVATQKEDLPVMTSEEVQGVVANQGDPRIVMANQKHPWVAVANQENCRVVAANQEHCRVVEASEEFPRIVWESEGLTRTVAVGGKPWGPLMVKQEPDTSLDTSQEPNGPLIIYDEPEEEAAMDIERPLPAGQSLTRTLLNTTDRDPRRKTRERLQAVPVQPQGEELSVPGAALSSPFKSPPAAPRRPSPSGSAGSEGCAAACRPPGAADWPAGESSESDEELLRRIARRVRQERADTAPCPPAADLDGLCAQVRTAAAAGDGALRPVLAALAARPDLAHTFHLLCARLTHAGPASDADLRALHSLGASLLLQSRARSAWPDAYSLTVSLLSCKLSLDSPVQPAGGEVISPFELRLAMLEAFIHSGHLTEAIQFTSDQSLLSSESDLCRLLPLLGLLQRRLTAEGPLSSAVTLLGWIADVAEKHENRTTGTDWHKLTELPRLVSATLRAALPQPAPELALPVLELAQRRRLRLAADCLRGALHLRLRLKQFNQVRELYNAGRAEGVYPAQQVAPPPLLVRLPCWMTLQEMLVTLEEFVRAVSAASAGRPLPPPPPTLTVSLTTDTPPPAPLVSGQVSDRPAEAESRLLQACRLMTPPLRLQPGPGPRFLVTAESLSAKLAVTAASSGRRRGLLPTPSAGPPRHVTDGGHTALL